MSLSQSKIEAFKASHYFVDDDPPLCLKIGEQNDGARILFASFNVESAAFITAWNPGGEQATLDTNYDRQADLLDAIEALRLNYFVGRGEHPDGDWFEESYFVLGISEEQAEMLGRQFDQAAIVYIPNSGVPELRLLEK